jgi:hypothetical protein
MEFSTLLRLALIPTYFSLVLSLLTATLIAHYWILGDYITLPYITIRDPDTKAKVEYFIKFLPPATDASVVSAATALIATIIALIAWYKLKRTDMDMDVNLVSRQIRLTFVGCIPN